MFKEVLSFSELGSMKFYSFGFIPCLKRLFELSTGCLEVGRARIVKSMQFSACYFLHKRHYRMISVKCEKKKADPPNRDHHEIIKNALEKRKKKSVTSKPTTAKARPLDPGNHQRSHHAPCQSSPFCTHGGRHA